MNEQMRQNRLQGDWKKKLSFWHFSNPVYTVDATYLYTEAGSNAQILAGTFSTSKMKNLLKILSFTDLNGIPFWVSKVYAGNVSDQEICERELTENPDLLSLLGGKKQSSETETIPFQASLDPSCIDLEHVLYGVPVELCTNRPIGIFDRGFKQAQLEAFGLLVAIPAYLASRVSLTDAEALYSAYLSSRRVIIENYHGRVKSFQRLRLQMDLRVATNYGAKLWLAGTYLRLNNHSPLRPSETVENEDGKSKKQKNEEDFDLLDQSLNTIENNYQTFLSSLTETSPDISDDISSSTSTSSTEFQPCSSSDESSSLSVDVEEPHSIHTFIDEHHKNHCALVPKNPISNFRSRLQQLKTFQQNHEVKQLDIPHPSKALKCQDPMPSIPLGLSAPSQGIV
jgi:hypothetical protein